MIDALEAALTAAVDDLALPTCGNAPGSRVRADRDGSRMNGPALVALGRVVQGVDRGHP